jgi:hypothetical protein
MAIINQLLNVGILSASAACLNRILNRRHTNAIKEEE